MMDPGAAPDGEEYCRALLIAARRFNRKIIKTKPSFNKRTIKRLPPNRTYDYRKHGIVDFLQ